MSRVPPDKNLLSQLQSRLPVSGSRSSYAFHHEARHPTGNVFRESNLYKFETSSGDVIFVNTNYTREAGRNIVADLMSDLGLKS
jgi:hypothetical protein